jgi:D-aminopeptidase
MRPRLRQLGLSPGDLPPGPLNAITDVPGVRVGQATLTLGQGALKPGHGPVRTGVTVVLPHGDNLFREKVPAAVHTINGYGKAAGFEQVRELGVLEAPLALTNTLNVGLILDALVQAALRDSPEIGVTTSSINIVVGETNDGYLNDLQGRHVCAEHVFAALESASSGPFELGAAGAGTGTVCYGWKGGIGTASRILPPELGGYRLGALLQTNFGRASDLLIGGWLAGKHFQPPPEKSPERPDAGSVMIVLATDAPLDSLQLGRLCRRAQGGLARTGSHFAGGSGDFVIAFSTAYRLPHSPPQPVALRPVLADDSALNGLFRAVGECVEEAVLDSLACAETVEGRDGHVAYAFPMAEALAIRAGKFEMD